MSAIRWRGGAAATAGVQSYLFGGTWEATDLVTVTIGSKAVTFVAGSTVIATVLTGLVTAYNALSSSSYPEFAEMTASSDATHFYLTGDTAGKPFIATLLTTETDGSTADAQTIDGGTGASTGVVVTACTGPNHVDNALNWYGGVAPTTGDTVYVEDNADDLKYGLSQTGVTLAATYVAASFTGTIGLPPQNQDATAYPEYRARKWAVKSTLDFIGYGEGSGSAQLFLDRSSAASTVTVYSTGSGQPGREALDWIGSSGSNVFNLIDGSVSVAGVGGDTATIATLNQAGGTLRTGQGVTLTTLTKTGGSTVLEAGLTTLAQEGGTTTQLAGGCTTATIDGGTHDYRGTGTIGTLTVNSAGAEELANETRGCTITNKVVLYAGATFHDPHGRTVAAGLSFQTIRCELADCNVTCGVNKSYAVT